MSDYVLWQWAPVKHGMSIDKFENFDDGFLFYEGKPLEKDFPEDFRLLLHPDRPRDTVATDMLQNTERLLVVSPKLKAFLEEYGVKEVEYLPATVVDVKGKPIKEQYFVVNPLKPLDCLDVDASGVTFSMIVPADIDEVATLVLVPSKLDPSRELFRIAHFPDVFVVSRKLAGAITENGFTAIRFAELEEFGV